MEGRNTIEATVYAADGDVTTLTADVTVTVSCDEAGLVHDLNCDVIDPVEAVVIEALAPLLRLLRF